MASSLVLVTVLLLSPILLVGSLVVYWYFAIDVECLRKKYTFRPIGLASNSHIEVGMLHESYVDVMTLPGFFVLLLLLHEDDLFFAHHGVNFREVGHRVGAFLSGRDSLRGGSSISQQISKHIFSPTRRRHVIGGWFEKLRELVVAKKLECAYSKRELLSLYISSIRFGLYPAFGIKQASRIYFAKAPEGLSLHEGLFLCGLIPRPRLLAGLLFLERKVDEYPVTTAFVKCVDLLRLIAWCFSWRTLDDVEQLSYRDVECLAQEMHEYSPDGLPSELELALEQRALLEITHLREMIVRMSCLEPPLFPRDAWAGMEQV